MAVTTALLAILAAGGVTTACWALCYCLISQDEESLNRSPECWGTSRAGEALEVSMLARGGAQEEV